MPEETHDTQRFLAFTPMRGADIALAVLAVTLWGGNFLAAKIALVHFPPLMLTAMRFIIIAAVLLPFVPRPRRADLGRIFLLSVFLGVLHFSLLFGSLYQGLGIMTSILVAQLGTPFACLLSWLFNKDAMSRMAMFGMALGFAGVALIAGTPDAARHMLGFAMALFGGFAWGASTIIFKRIETRNIYTVLGWMGLFCSPQLVALSWLLERDQYICFTTAPFSAWMALAYTLLCSTFAAYGIWYALLGRYRISQIAPFALMTPVSGLLISRFYTHDPITLPLAAGGMLTLLGVGLSLRSRPRQAVAPD